MRGPVTPHSLRGYAAAPALDAWTRAYAATGVQCCLRLSHPLSVSTQPPPQPTTNWQWVTAATLRSSRGAPVTCAAAPARTLSPLQHQDARGCRRIRRFRPLAPTCRRLPIGCRNSRPTTPHGHSPTTRGSPPLHPTYVRPHRGTRADLCDALLVSMPSAWHRTRLAAGLPTTPSSAHSDANPRAASL